MSAVISAEHLVAAHRAHRRPQEIEEPDSSRPLASRLLRPLAIAVRKLSLLTAPIVDAPAGHSATIDSANVYARLDARTADLLNDVSHWLGRPVSVGTVGTCGKHRPDLFVTDICAI